MKTAMRILLALGVTLALSGCVEEVTKSLEELNSALTKPVANGQALRGGQNKYTSNITAEQVAKIDSALSVQVADPEIATAIQEAMPNIKAVVKIASCNPFHTAQPYPMYAAPGKTIYHSPMRGMSYHNKAYCLDVVRIHGWSMPAKNALRFEAVFHASDSGQGDSDDFEMVKQPSGEWLFTK